MSDPCQDFRLAWLESALDEGARRGVESADGHLAQCAACSGWLRGVRSQVEALTGLERRALPEDLEDAVGEDLRRAAEDPSSPLAAELRRLPRLEAPEELDRLVDRLLAAGSALEPRAPAHERDPARTARSVSTLDYPTAPSVLERLVGEELADPARHRAERFVGNLAPMPAPAELRRRVDRMLRPRRVPILAGLGTLAAACLALWVGLGRGEDRTDVRRLRVVRVDEAVDFEPVARGLAASLGGGWTPGLGEDGR